MDAFGMLLEVSIFLVIFIIMALVLLISIALYLYNFFISEEIKLKSNKNTSANSPDISIRVNDNKQNMKQKKDNKAIKIIGFHQNEIIENQNRFKLGEKIENLDHLSKNLINSKNNIIEKKEELSIMFVESLSSLNSWRNNEIENEIFKKVNWNLEKSENKNKEESLVYQYIFPTVKSSSEHSKLMHAKEDNKEDEKEEELFSKYKLGICRIFEENENNLKTNIVKEVNGNIYKIYSEGNPCIIKKKCIKETIPENFNEILGKYKENGYYIIGLAGKKMKMNYIQSQRINRSKCECNMIFLGFAIYKVENDENKSVYSWCLILLEKNLYSKNINIINKYIINNVYRKTLINLFFVFSFFYFFQIIIILIIFIIKS